MTSVKPIAIVSLALLAGCFKSSAPSNEPGGDTAATNPNGPKPTDTTSTRGVERRVGKKLTAKKPPRDPAAVPIYPVALTKLGVSAVVPTMAAPGSLVTIFGGGFTGDPAKDGVTVGGVAWEVVESAAGHIVARVPDGAKSGAVQVKIGRKTSKSTVKFGVLAADQAFGRANTSATQGLLGSVYKIGEPVTELPAFNDLGEPVGTIMVDTLEANGRFAGFPVEGGSLSEWFGLHFKGSLNVTEAGEYDLCLNSDDGTQLYVEQTLLIDNDGVHEATETCELVYLDPGEYGVDVLYFQGTEGLALEWTWAKDGGEKQPVPLTALFPPAG